ncbi:MAG: ABC transporter permease [Pseudomonadota bacterium]|nr:ABC transporter permease [Pseudomonadota bacterium]
MVNRHTIWLAWRNLRNPRRGFGLSVMTNVSIGGVAIGVMALVVVLSIMGGLARSLRQSMYEGTPHVEVQRRTDKALGFSMQRYPLSFFKDKFPNMQAIQPYIRSDVVLKNERHLSTATLFAIDPDSNSKLWGFQRPLELFGSTVKRVSSADAQPQIMLGEGLAYQLGVELGDTLLVLNPNRHTGSEVGAVASAFEVVGIFATTLFNYDEKWAVVTLAAGRKFMPDYDPSLDTEQYVSGVAMNFSNPDELKSSMFDLAGTPLRAVTWQENNEAVIFALQLERIAMGAILLLVVLVASFSIGSTMMMTVFYRRSQIALLRALGICKRRTFQVYLVQGLLIGAVGTALGMSFGLAALLLLDKMPIPLPTDIYVLNALAVRFLWQDYLLIGILALFLSSLSATYPAAVAARASPTKGLAIA